MLFHFYIHQLTVIKQLQLILYAFLTAAEENGLNDRTINESQSGEESSEEDIYCDSLDPDQVIKKS